MIDKNYCMSSYLAFRYIEKDDVDFCEGLNHRTAKLPQVKDIQFIANSCELEECLQEKFKTLTKKSDKLGILLSGGMDSACLASYMPDRSYAYTFRFDNGKFANEELRRAEKFAKINNLILRYIDIDWESMKGVLPLLMRHKASPVHSIEPQIYLAAVKAKQDGVSKIIIGDAADYVFYGMDGLLSKDWTFDEFVARSIYIYPTEILKEAVDIMYLYERYRTGNGIDFIGFYDKVVTEESYSSYENAFETAGMDYYDPYEDFRMVKPVDLKKIRSGNSKYFIRELFRSRYPCVDLPKKNPMPRMVDEYFKTWEGPSRPEFKSDVDIDRYTGNQKWQIYCLEQFLDMIDREK